MGGSRLMIEEGLLDRFGARDVAFAIHVSPTETPGEISTRPGPLMASPGLFHIVVKGRGGHPAEPSLALDPIPIACEIVLALQRLASRMIDISGPTVITVKKFQAGTGAAAIPETATLLGTVRTFSDSGRAEVTQGIRSTAHEITTARGGEVEITTQDGYPPVINDSGAVDLVRQVVNGIFGPASFRILSAPVLPSDDFSYILQRVPGAMVFLGARPATKDPIADLHSPRMILDEKVLAAGVALHAGLALTAVAAP